MFTPPTKIDIKIPRAWNLCSREQLETIATVLMGQTLIADVISTSSMFQLKCNIFLALANIEVISTDKADSANIASTDDLLSKYYVCRLPGEKQTFRLYLWQLQSFVEDNLKWIDDEKGNGLTNFVYPTYKKWILYPLPHYHLYDGPAVLMQDFTWQRYRFAQDYMEWYVHSSNELVRMTKKRRVYSVKEIARQEKEVRRAMGLFLATIYNRRTDYVNESTGLKEHDFMFRSDQSQANYQDFVGFSPVKWQVILLWWSGMMHYLQQRYPRCFKRQNTSDGHRSTPLELYTRTVATMEKYLGLDEQTVNDQNFHIVLQHMEDMAQQNEEMEKIRNK